MANHVPSVLAVLLTGGSLLVASALPSPVSAQEDLRTGAERSDFNAYTSYEEMMEYLEAVRASSAGVRMGVYGETWEGRELPYLVFSDPLVTQPRDAEALERPVLALSANVHGDERTPRESLLILARELATPGTPMNALLDRVVVLVVPMVNPDGFAAEGGAQRGNAWGIDLNRDYVKVEQPEIRGLLENVIHRWNPHLFVDGHNGGSFPYNLNYQCPSHAQPDPRITALCDREIFPAIDARLEAEGYRSFWYRRGTETAWTGGGPAARIGRNYGGFANTVTILFESPSGQELSDGVRAALLGYRALVEYAAEHPARLMGVVRDARRETLDRSAIDEVVVEMEYAPEEFPVTYLIAEGEGEDREVRTVTSDSLMKRPVVTRTRPLPWAYLLPRDARDAVRMLRRHGIAVERLTDEATLPVDAYVLEDVIYEQAYNHAAAADVRVAAEAVTVERTFPAGTWIVPTGQSMGRLVAHMLEPETNDNVVYWNTMDAWLPKPALQAVEAGEVPEWDRVNRPDDADGPPLVPIFKLMEPTPLPSRLVDPAEEIR